MFRCVNWDGIRFSWVLVTGFLRSLEFGDRLGQTVKIGARKLMDFYPSVTVFQLFGMLELRKKAKKVMG